MRDPGVAPPKNATLERTRGPGFASKIVASARLQDTPGPPFFHAGCVGAPPVYGPEARGSGFASKIVASAPSHRLAAMLWYGRDAIIFT